MCGYFGEERIRGAHGRVEARLEETEVTFDSGNTYQRLDVAHFPDLRGRAFEPSNVKSEWPPYRPKTRARRRPSR